MLTSEQRAAVGELREELRAQATEGALVGDSVPEETFARWMLALDALLAAYERARKDAVLGFNYVHDPRDNTPAEEYEAAWDRCEQYERELAGEGREGGDG